MTNIGSYPSLYGVVLRWTSGSAAWEEGGCCLVWGRVALLALLDAQFLYDLVKFVDDLFGDAFLHRGEVLG